ncbi:hypothetical protein D1646_01555 [Pseudoflavonifractor sp. 60]|uniref:putative ABC transporter permease n=1 Tax=Pseudoflavonifractor sp. 60 TaxID=2304576 RepID=UPI00137013D7|nr:putative ABC transporter permease [Pseudoflavonifractor sp. 60]NBI65511.1 hypothetical protein [Pseudoflavonifractor sp. 60]
MIWFWSFFLYSFAGFVLEVLFSWLAGTRSHRKGLLVLPICPVYGLGACLILLLPPWVQAWPWALFLLGGVTATAAEYFDAVYHQRVLGVSFWDYSGLPGNLHGRVCLPFSLAWGVLSLVLVYGVNPALLPWLARIPAPVSAVSLAALVFDAALTLLILRQTGDTARLQWYRRPQ